MKPEMVFKVNEAAVPLIFPITIVEQNAFNYLVESQSRTL